MVEQFPDKQVMDALPPDPMDGNVCEVLSKGVCYVFHAVEGKWFYSDKCLGYIRDHGNGVISVVKEREVYV